MTIVKAFFDSMSYYPDDIMHIVSIKEKLDCLNDLVTDVGSDLYDPTENINSIQSKSSNLFNLLKSLCSMLNQDEYLSELQSFKEPTSRVLMYLSSNEPWSLC